MLVLRGAEKKLSTQQVVGMCNSLLLLQQEKGTFSSQKWVWSVWGEGREGGRTWIDPLTVQNVFELREDLKWSFTVWKEAHLGLTQTFASILCPEPGRSWFSRESKFVQVKNILSQEYQKKQDWERLPAWPKSLRYSELLTLMSNSNLKLLFYSILLFSHCQYEIVFSLQQ